MLIAGAAAVALPSKVPLERCCPRSSRQGRRGGTSLAPFRRARKRSSGGRKSIPSSVPLAEEESLP
eukprot:7270321-Pyramimonas_sp.AAC.1